MRTVEREAPNPVRTRVILHESQGKGAIYHSSISVYLPPDEVQRLILDALQAFVKEGKGKGATRPCFINPRRAIRPLPTQRAR